MIVVGLDVGKVSVHACALQEKPADLKQFARRFKALIFKATPDAIRDLLALGDIFVLEPTGSYSYFWISALSRGGKEVRIVSPRRIRHYREYHGLFNKADNPDAIAIASYALENLDSPNAFLRKERLRVGELSLKLASTSRNKNPIANRLGQALCYECPEIVKTYEQAKRDWLSDLPPAPYRIIAGEPISKRMLATAKKVEATIGTGLSEHSRDLARQLCEMERMECRLEIELARELAAPEYLHYIEVFAIFSAPPRVQAALLSKIYPFESFLVDGRPRIEYVNGSESRRRSGMTKRDRSLGEFKLCLGMGKILSQSGGITEWKTGGSKHARCALWQYTKIVVIMNRGKDFGKTVEPIERSLRVERLPPWLNRPLVEATAIATGCTPEVAELRLHYEFHPSKGNRRVCATAGRFTRNLYKHLLKRFRTD